MERMASMSQYQGDEPVLKLIPALWLSAHQRPSQSILSSQWGLGPGSWQAATWFYLSFENQELPFGMAGLVLCSCSHIFRKWVKIKLNINSPASCRTTRGRMAKPGGTQEKGPASKPRATPGLQLPGQTRHHSRASAAKYFYSNRFCMYRSTEKWHPDAEGRKLLPIKMWLLDWFVVF